MRTRTQILFSLFVLSVFTASGQENVLHYEIQRTKELNVDFKDISSSFKEVSKDKSMLEKFIDPHEVSFFEYVPQKVKANDSDRAISLVLPVNNKKTVLELLEVPGSFYDYEVATSDGKKYSANKAIKHYRGVVNGVPNSLAAITFYENEIIGLIATDEGNFNIAKDKQSGKHLLYNDKNLREKPVFECGTIDDYSTSYDPEILLQQHDITQQYAVTQNVVPVSKMVKFYFETEYDIFQNKGSISAVEAYITALFNQVAVLYQNENILTYISQINIWTSTDPYTATDPETLLVQFRNNRTSFNGDLGQLLTFRNINGGWSAGFSGLCNNDNTLKLSVAMIYSTYDNVPTYSWSVEVITHEFGHLLGSRHTHACVWNGNNTAIDGCWATEPTTTGGIACPNPGYPTNGNKGTIMSYCHLDGRPGINFNLGFGQQPGNVIRNSVANASCLQAAMYITGWGVKSVDFLKIIFSPLFLGASFFH
jgi:hypothetical protein